MSDYRFAINPRWADLARCSALVHSRRSGDYRVSDYETTLSIKWARHGETWYETPQGRYRVAPDTFLILNEGQRYSMEVEAASNTETFCPFFQPGFVKGEFYERLYPMTGRLAQAMRSIGDVPLEDSFFDLAEALHDLRGDTKREAQSFPGLRASTREEMYRRLYRARDFLYSCYAESVSVSDAANVAAISTFHFQRMFKSAFGISPMQFLQRRRLEVARHLLTRTEEDVTSICLAVGFESLGSFSSLFKRRFGVAPSQMR